MENGHSAAIYEESTNEHDNYKSVDSAINLARQAAIERAKSKNKFLQNDITLQQKVQIEQNKKQRNFQSEAVRFNFAPFSKKQAQMLTWWMENSPQNKAGGLIVDGSIRSGKTLCLSLSFCMWAMASFNNCNFALCGKTVGSLKRNVLTSLFNMLYTLGYTAVQKHTENLIIIFKGNVKNRFYLFGAKDESSADLIQGITLAGVLFDEVALMPESFVNQATARCSVKNSKWWFNCNPEGPYHWFYKQFIQKASEKNLLYLHCTMQDNLSLSSEVKQRYYALYSGVFFDRFIRGLWAVAEGLVYPLVSQNRQNYTFYGDIAQNAKYYISVDYGTRNACSMGLFCISDGVAIRLKEFYHDSRVKNFFMTDEDYCDELEKLAADNVIQKVVVDPSAASFIAAIKRRGKFAVKGADNNVLSGIRTVAAMLAANRLKFSQNCADTFREFSLYRWDENGLDKDSVIKQDDHAMDDIRYFCYSILARELRWENWRINENSNS